MRPRYSVWHNYDTDQGYTTSRHTYHVTRWGACITRCALLVLDRLRGRRGSWAVVCRVPLYYYDDWLPNEWADAGAWRSYRLSASGDTLEELIADATIAEVDQDGGDLDCYGLDGASSDVSETAQNVLVRLVRAA